MLALFVRLLAAHGFEILPLVLLRIAEPAVAGGRLRANAVFRDGADEPALGERDLRSARAAHGNEREKEEASFRDRREELRIGLLVVVRDGGRVLAAVILHVVAVDDIGDEARLPLRLRRPERDAAAAPRVVAERRKELVERVVIRRKAEHPRDVMRETFLLRPFRRVPFAPRRVTRNALDGTAGDERIPEVRMQTHPRVFEDAARLVDDEAALQTRRKADAPRRQRQRTRLAAALALAFHHRVDLLALGVVADPHELLQAERRRLAVRKLVAAEDLANLTNRRCRHLTRPFQASRSDAGSSGRPTIRP